MPVPGRWPLLERIPRRRFLRFRRSGRIASLTGALAIAVLSAMFVEHDFPWRHLLTAAALTAWVLAVTWTTKQRWLRWLRDDFNAEVNSKMDAIRRAAPLN
jgi:hypothetical protein